jgi:hypothetical protein
MVKKTRSETRSEAPASGSWPVVLVAAAAAGQTDGGAELHQLLEDAGFAEKPHMSIVIKRPPPRMHQGKPLDPSVDDVLDALRALCA